MPTESVVPLISERLEPLPSSVGRARRLVVEALVEARFGAELVDVARLLVSEVVTNSLLHAGTKIGLCCHRSGGGVRIEVFDESPVVPSLRHYVADASTGRGLGLVSTLASSWGVRRHDDGKTLWFQVGDAGGPDSPLRPGPGGGTDEPTGAVLTVQLRGASPPLVRATIEQGDALLRELALLAIGGAVDNAVPDATHLPLIDVAPILAAAERAALSGQPRADLEVSLAAHAGPAALERLRLLDVANVLARDGRLLSAPALPEIAACHHWLYAQIAEQAQGFPPQAWALPDPLEPAQVAAVLPAQELARLQRISAAAIVADDANRIIFVNPPAGQLLGWAPDALVGQRLTVIIPPELREAHLAGFSRLQVTGEARILRSPVHVPALRRDGSSVQILLTIDEVAGGAGRTAFCAVLVPRGPGDFHEG